MNTKKSKWIPGSALRAAPEGRQHRAVAGFSESRVPQSGFTLIEMLAVIVLIAIGASVTAVALHGRSRGELQAAAQRVAAGLRDTRTRAMATGKPQWFSVDLRAHAYTVPGREPRGFPAAATVQVESAAEAGGQRGIARIGYFPDGSSSGGNIILSEAHRGARVDVDWLTGAVTVDSGVPR
jgi:general secretion pathway protein H